MIKTIEADSSFRNEHVPVSLVKLGEGFVGFGEFLPRDIASPVGLYHQSIVMLCLKKFIKSTVKFLNFRTPENFAVIYLKFKQRGHN